MDGRTVPVRLIINDAVVASREVVVTSASSTEVIFTGVAAPVGAVVEVQIPPSDALAPDHKA